MTASQLLVGFNFSEGSYTAFWHAVRLARRSGHRLTLLHVDVHGTRARSFIGRRRRQMLDELSRVAGRQGVEVDVRLLTGSVAETLEGVLVDEGADLVVLGRGEAGGWPRRPRRARLSRLLAERLEVPILMVPGTAGVEATHLDADAPLYRHLLVASSLCGGDEPLLRHALQLRVELDARLTLVDTSRRAPARRQGTSPRYTGIEPAFGELSGELRVQLRDALNGPLLGGRPTVQVVHSGLRRSVLRIADALDVDLLLLGPTRRSVWRRVRRGTASLATHLRRAPMPVLSMPVTVPGTLSGVPGTVRMAR